MGYYHLLSDAFKNKTIFAGLCKIYTVGVFLNLSKS